MQRFTQLMQRPISIHCNESRVNATRRRQGLTEGIAMPGGRLARQECRQIAPRRPTASPTRRTPDVWTVRPRCELLRTAGGIGAGEPGGARRCAWHQPRWPRCRLCLPLQDGGVWACGSPQGVIGSLSLSDRPMLRSRYARCLRCFPCDRARRSAEQRNSGHAGSRRRSHGLDGRRVAQAQATLPSTVCRWRRPARAAAGAPERYRRVDPQVARVCLPTPPRTRGCSSDRQ